MCNSPEMRKVLIVDDQGLIREGLLRIISRQKDLDCCDAVEGVNAARKSVEIHKPHLILVDLLLPDGCGLELIKELTLNYPSLLALVISQCDEMLYAERALKAGARGYIMKNRAVSEIPKAIRTILAGEYYFSPQVAAQALHQMAAGKAHNQRNGVANLSDRELLVFQLLGSGIKTREVADKLHLSIKTVETHRENIKHKLKFSDSVELIRHATNWVNSQGSSYRLNPAEMNASLSKNPSPQ